jgi:hypothetical protein
MSGKVSIAEKILIIEDLDHELKQLSKNLATIELISKSNHYFLAKTLATKRFHWQKLWDNCKMK